MKKDELLQILLFFVKLNLLAIPLYILLYINFSYEPLQHLVTFLSYKILRAVGFELAMDKTRLIFAKGFELNFVDIDMDCTGWKSLYALIALTLATPSMSWKKKSIFLSISLPSIFFFNIFRIVLCVYLSFLKPGLFYLIHDFLWKFGLITAVLASWAFWLKYEKRI
ncbi:MAG: exosortase/archaeosortase family protein [Candidatus Aenigmatarchaeota archaeon]